jgi:uncharacterized protein (TIGR00725 family)
MTRLFTIGVMGSGRKKQTELAHPLGEALAHLPVNLLTGGGGGVMYSVSQAFSEVAPREGKVIGVIPTKLENGIYIPTSPNYPNPFVEIPIITPLGVFNSDDPNAVNRNYLNILSSDAVIALPGGVGTKQEVGLAQRFNKPVILHGPTSSFSEENFDATLRREEDLTEVLNWVRAEIGNSCLLRNEPKIES